MHVQMVDQKLALDAVCVGEGIYQLVACVLDPGRKACVQLHAVARLERRVLDDGRAALGTEAESADALAQLDGSRAMTEPEANEAVHAANTLTLQAETAAGHCTLVAQSHKVLPPPY